MADDDGSFDYPSNIEDYTPSFQGGDTPAAAATPPDTQLSEKALLDFYKRSQEPVGQPMTPAAPPPSAEQSPAVMGGSPRFNTLGAAQPGSIFSPVPSAQQTGTLQPSAEPSAQASPSVPLPMARPSNAPASQGPNVGTSYDVLQQQRAPMADQLSNNPALMTKLATLAIAEEGHDSNARVAMAESVLNRGVSQGTPDLNKMIDPNYYAPFKDGNFARAQREIAANPGLLQSAIADVNTALNGSNYSNLATDNASGDVKANSATNSTLAYLGQNGEGFFRKDINPDYHGAQHVQNTVDWYNKTNAAMNGNGGPPPASGDTIAANKATAQQLASNVAPPTSPAQPAQPGARPPINQAFMDKIAPQGPPAAAASVSQPPGGPDTSVLGRMMADLGLDPKNPNAPGALADMVRGGKLDDAFNIHIQPQQQQPVRQAQTSYISQPVSGMRQIQAGPPTPVSPVPAPVPLPVGPMGALAQLSGYPQGG